MFQLSARFRATLGGLIVSLLILAVPAMAEPDRDAGGEPAANATVGFAGLQIHIDPETGSMRAPTAEESHMLAKAMQQRFGRYLRPSTPSFTKDGNLQVVLGLEHFNFSILTLDSEGQPITHCTSGLEATDALLSHDHSQNDSKREEW